MFIEIHRDGKRMLVSTMWISRVNEKTGWIYIGDGEEVVSCDESYEEIVWKIAEGEGVIAEEESKR
jgi:hypothetical protein